MGMVGRWNWTRGARCRVDRLSRATPACASLGATSAANRRRNHGKPRAWSPRPRTVASPRRRPLGAVGACPDARDVHPCRGGAVPLSVGALAGFRRATDRRCSAGAQDTREAKRRRASRRHLRPAPPHRSLPEVLLRDATRTSCHGLTREHLEHSSRVSKTSTAAAACPPRGPKPTLQLNHQEQQGTTTS